MGSDVAKIKGFVGRGGEVARYNPHEVFIVGIDVEPDEDLWPFECARLDEEQAEVEAEIAGKWTPGPDDLSLASVRLHGILQPGIGVRLKGRVFVVDCRRRALRGRIVWDEEKKKGVAEADRKGALPMRLISLAGEIGVRGGKTLAEIYAINLAANQHKPMTAMQRAQAMLHFYDHLPEKNPDGTPVARSRQVDATAKQFGVTERTVENNLRLLSTSAKVQEAVTEGVDVGGNRVHLSMANATQLSALPKKEQDAALAKMIATGAVKGHKAKASIHGAVKNAKGDPEPTGRMLSRAVIERWHRALAVGPAKRALGRVLGNVDALRGWPELVEAFDKATAKGKR